LCGAAFSLTVVKLLVLLIFNFYFRNIDKIFCTCAVFTHTPPPPSSRMSFFLGTKAAINFSFRGPVVEVIDTPMKNPTTEAGLLFIMAID